MLVGEPGSGRSDLAEAIGRVLDADTLRSRRASELDFFDLDTSRDVHIELVIGELGAPATVALTRSIELWDLQDERLTGALPLGQVRDPDRLNGRHPRPSSPRLDPPCRSPAAFARGRRLQPGPD